jgi:SAM-dependent methyltransferase
MTAHEHEVISGEAAWDERYRSRAGGIWSGQPNAVLVAEAADLEPGRALDVGCGEGADALWLAGRGWQVTGVDIATVALDRAAAAARTRGLTVTWVRADLLADPPAPAAFELVTAHFMHLPAAEREKLFAALADAVVPGGTLLFVGHDPSDGHTTMGRPRVAAMFVTADDVAAGLDRDVWEVQVAEARPRSATDPEGRAVTIRDAVLRARKRG